MKRGFVGSGEGVLARDKIRPYKRLYFGNDSETFYKLLCFKTALQNRRKRYRVAGVRLNKYRRYQSTCPREYEVTTVEAQI